MAANNFTTPTSLLEAVNSLLESIGEAPVNALGDGLEDAKVAENILRKTSRFVQMRGWWFNTEDAYPLYRNQDNEINVPLNTLKCDTQDKFILWRGTRLYDKKAHSYTFTVDKTVTLVLALDFEEMPEAARQYITIRAARVFQDQLVGSQVLHAFHKEDELEARNYLEEAELEAGNYNLQQNREFYSMLQRSV